MAKVIGPEKVEGAMVIRGIWRIYTASADVRLKLLTTGISLRYKSVTLLDELPTSRNMTEKPETEKITVSNLPLELDNKDIQTFLTSFTGVKLVSDVKYGNCRSPSGDLTDYKNGTRYCYAECPVGTIPRNCKFGNFVCNIYYKSQQPNPRRKPVCRVCSASDHLERSPSCPGYDASAKEGVVSFRSNQEENGIFSNFYPCSLIFEEDEFGSVEHLYQFKQAMASGNEDLAKKIKTAPTAKQAFEFAKDITASDDWDKIKLDVMTDIIHLKVDQCSDFEHALLNTKEKLLVEATSDCFWAAGLPPKLVNVTDPKYYPGTNMLGEIMMEIRNDLITKITNGTMVMGFSDISNIADTTGDTTQHDVLESDESIIEHQNPFQTIEEEVLTSRKIVSAQRKTPSTTSSLKTPKPLSTQKTLASYFTQNPKFKADPQALKDPLFSDIVNGEQTNS